MAMYYYMMSQLLYVCFSMSNLKNLETLDMQGNNFSEGLPDIFTSMTSLMTLNMEKCELPTLPERLVKQCYMKCSWPFSSIIADTYRICLRFSIYNCHFHNVSIDTLLKFLNSIKLSQDCI